MVCYTNRQIAARLGVHYTSVRNTLSGIYQILGVGNGDKTGRRIRALTAALRGGLLNMCDVSDGDRTPLVRKAEGNVRFHRNRERNVFCSEKVAGGSQKKESQ